jgi:NitT/TauT family transport system permease protein
VNPDSAFTRPQAAALPPRPAWLAQLASDRWSRVLSLLVLMVLWQVAATLADTATLPSPLAVAQRAYQEAASGLLGAQLGVTLLRVAVAFTLAMALGIAIGIAMGRWRRLDAWLDPWIVLGLNLPALVTIILCYVWFGLNDAAAIVAVAINKIPLVVVTVREGARALDADLAQVARAFRLDRWRSFVHVALPQLFPYLMAAARSGLSLIWKIVLVVELLGRSDGVGYQLHLFFQLFDITGLLAYALAFVAVVMAIEAALLRPLEARCSRWRRC